MGYFYPRQKNYFRQKWILKCQFGFVDFFTSWSCHTGSVQVDGYAFFTQRVSW
jgi:hypothetical protein